MMKPDFTTAATQASRVLIKYQISRCPIYPQQVIQDSPLCSMVSFASLAEKAEIERNHIVTSLHKENDTVMCSFRHLPDGSPHYTFAFNREEKIGRVRCALAVELGHVYLGHIGFRDNDQREAEALTFAHHFLFPRPLIRLLQERNFVFTDKSFARVFGDCKWCLDNLITSAPVTVPPELNLLLKEQFTPYVDSLAASGDLTIAVNPDDRPLDFSGYMDGYEE